MLMLDADGEPIAEVLKQIARLGRHARMHEGEALAGSIQEASGGHRGCVG